jgi:hypothetical protein
VVPKAANHEGRFPKSTPLRWIQLFPIGNQALTASHSPHNALVLPGERTPLTHQ